MSNINYKTSDFDMDKYQSILERHWKQCFSLFVKSSNFGINKLAWSKGDAILSFAHSHMWHVANLGSTYVDSTKSLLQDEDLSYEVKKDFAELEIEIIFLQACDAFKKSFPNLDLDNKGDLSDNYKNFSFMELMLEKREIFLEVLNDYCEDISEEVA